ncbi:MAG: HPr(Ser) kinase/phosphatase, partial [Erysipelotrichaceae bacterium]|nr:HPr(Ser) kinase/phosphatase [Erysipelotrichaceae bacterium]
MMNEEQQYKAFDFLTNERTPMILISRDLPCPKILYDLAYQKNMPVFSSYAPTDSLIAEIISYLEEFFAEVVTLHGVLMQVYGRGVLITAESGMGKSEIALELIRKGHTFVADDRVDVYRAHNQLYGGPAEVLENLMEIRGVGVLNVAEMFGAIATTNKSSISCIIHLERLNPEKEYDRLGFFNQQTETILGITIPKMIIPVASGRSTATVIEAAISNHILRQKGIDSGKNFHDRLKEFIEANKEEK